MKRLTLALICALTLIFTSCSDDSEFVDAMTDAPIYLDYLSAFYTEHFTDIFNVEYGEVKAAVRCKVERGESEGKSLDTVIPQISTLYTLHISEVYFYDGVHEVPETLEVDAPYGIVGDVKWMTMPIPVFCDGGEYIMLLFGDLAEDGTMRYTFNHMTVSRAVEVVGDNFVPMWPCPETFDEFETLDSLEDALRAVGTPDSFKLEVTSRPIVPKTRGAHYDGLDELFAKHPISHVVRARVGREECEERGYYDIVTYHSLEISDVLLGELPEFPSGTPRLAMSYGIDEGRVKRAEEDAPILDDGAEYLLFLTAVETESGLEFRLAHEPTSALKLVADGYICQSEFASMTFGRYRTYDALAEAIREQTATDAFNLALSKVEDFTMQVSWQKFDSLAELIEKTRATAVVRARVARAPSRTVRANELETSYAIAVTERLWGDCGDSLSVTLPHGVDGERIYRKTEGTPLLEDGGEYILILREEDISCELASMPHAAFRVRGDVLYPANELGESVIHGSAISLEKFMKALTEVK